MREQSLRFLKPLTFFGAVKEVALLYVHLFKPIVGIVLLAALVQVVVAIVTPQNPVVGGAISILGIIVNLFFYAWILYRADSILMNRPETIKDALRVAKKRFLYLLGVFVIYILLTLLLVLFAFGMQLLGSLLHLKILFAIITICLALFVFVLLTFSMPAVVLDQMPVLKSFEFSAKLVWHHWWHTFGVILIYLIPVVLLSFAIVFFLYTRNIFIITALEFIYHIITYPLMVALILVLYHDLKTGHQREAFKRVAELETK
jgi:hypothetical protein